MQYIHNNSLSARRELGAVSTVQVGIDALFLLGKPFGVHKPLCETSITNFAVVLVLFSFQHEFKL